MVINYSQTINKFTQLNAYPLPSIDDLVTRVSQYEHFSTVDLRSDYHQVPLNDKDTLYTAFEAGGQLNQFRRMPFGITNGIYCSQKVMDEFIYTNSLHDTNLKKGLIYSLSQYSLSLPPPTPQQAWGTVGNRGFWGGGIYE